VWRGFVSLVVVAVLFLLTIIVSVKEAIFELRRSTERGNKLLLLVLAALRHLADLVVCREQEMTSSVRERSRSFTFLPLLSSLSSPTWPYE
jgi:hypothetical protein